MNKAIVKKVTLSIHLRMARYKHLKLIEALQSNVQHMGIKEDFHIITFLQDSEIAEIIIQASIIHKDFLLPWLQEYFKSNDIEYNEAMLDLLS